MRELIRASWVIARRDYAATVLSRSFIFFLIGPLLPLIFGGIFSLVGIQGERQKAAPPAIVAIAEGDTARLLHAAGVRLGTPDGVRIVPPHGHGQPRALLADGAAAVLSGGLDHPMLTGPADRLGGAVADLTPLLDQARAQRALERLGATPRAVPIARRPLAVAADGPPPNAGADTARTSQFVLVFLTMLLGGMLLSNMLEEKSNKVIEILAAAVPVDAIFVGKLGAMLAMSLTGIVVWSLLGLGLYELIAARGAWPPEFSLDTPAVGWPMFAILGLIYFTASYLLTGAVFLGIGGQAKSAREVQTLSMPITMGQLFVFAFASAGIGAPNGGVAVAAMIFPWSSPFEMFARAAQLPGLWPHLVAILWQALWIALAVRVAAGMFRRSVLNSGSFMRIARG